VSLYAKARVLIVDDEPSVSQVFARMLTAAGHVTTVAHDGVKAIELLSVTPFDVVVSDIQMPEMDGLTLLRRIRAHDLDVPVVFVTGNPGLDTAISAIEHGAFRYLPKPVEAAKLIAAVESAARVHAVARLRRESAEELSNPPLGDRAGLEARFDAGLASLWMAAQPIVSWRDRSVFAYECLLRTDEATLRNPVDFVEAAERLDRRAELGRVIRARVAQQLGEAPAQVNILVNLHPHDLVDDDLLAADSPLAQFAPRVVLEVTERAALDEVPGALPAITRLRRLGYRIALDDLGAGYAGLSSFAQLQPEIVKVDMSLVRGIHASQTRRKLFAAFAELCRDLGTAIIAEGVETAQERDCLTALGGDLFQGYLFARPGCDFPRPIF
jgi:EAL domain-containing protein (putative c-di-GMP-specific phosphodiesterase class I)/CheY-like chemotaxis protein